MFYFYQLELRDPASMAEVPSFRAFAHVAGYRDRDGADYVAFSPSAPNFLIDPLWRVYQFSRDGLNEIAVDALPTDRQREIDVLSWRYYCGPVEAMFQRADRDEDASYSATSFLRIALIRHFCLCWVSTYRPTIRE
ncbi:MULTISPECIES: hypothetical protein [Burkholderia]|uniref:hypothetical protein n=1 Tax=Burkholderia TaxID=32008 RepID=UPI00118176E8|nr:MULTISPECIES: hypothetical protein [Burkholderia]